MKGRYKRAKRIVTGGAVFLAWLVSVAALGGCSKTAYAPAPVEETTEPADITITPETETVILEPETEEETLPEEPEERILKDGKIRSYLTGEMAGRGKGGQKAACHHDEQR